MVHPRETVLENFDRNNLAKRDPNNNGFKKRGTRFKIAGSVGSLFQKLQMCCGIGGGEVEVVLEVLLREEEEGKVS